MIKKQQASEKNSGPSQIIKPSLFGESTFTTAKSLLENLLNILAAPQTYLPVYYNQYSGYFLVRERLFTRSATTSRMTAPAPAGSSA